MHWLTILWDLDKGIPITENYSFRYYQVLFALGFVIGYYLMKRYFRREGAPLEWLDKLVTYMVLATVIGARLGHVFFYQWDYYSQHPIEIFKVWEGGLASHGAAIVIILALWWYSKKVTKRSMLWVLDRVVITIALAGCFIRLGNWFNSEIYGKPANSSIETVYAAPQMEYLGERYAQIVDDLNISPVGTSLETDSLSYPKYNLELVFNPQMRREDAEQAVRESIGPSLNLSKADDRNLIYQADVPLVWNENNHSLSLEVLGVPRWPTQLLEALGYLLIFVLLYFLYETPLKWKHGFLFGTFLVTIFGFRFFIEFLKVDQVPFEAGLQLNMGQNLSIPLVILGLAIMATAGKRYNDYSSKNTKA